MLGVFAFLALVFFAAGSAPAALSATITSRSEPSLATQIAALPFAVGDLADFRPVRTIADTGLLLTDGPRDVDPRFRQPLVVVDGDFGERPSEQDREVSAKTRFLDLARHHVAEVAIVGTKRDRDEGADVVRIDATGSKPPSGEPATLIGYMRFGKGGLLTTLCILPAQTHAEFTARCEQLAGSVHHR